MTNGWVPQVIEYIEGVTIGGRLLGIVDFKNYVGCWAWLNPIDGPKRFPGGFPDGTKQAHFGVNLIVYVLTQEGSITKRVMDTVSY